MNMKFKIIIIVGCVAIISFGIVLGIHSNGINYSNSSAMETQVTQLSASSSTPEIETSVDIGALFDKSRFQLKYVSFSPVLTRDEAISIAKNRLSEGMGWDTDNLPADATVTLFSGQIFKTDAREAGTANDLKAWIVVIKNVPFVGSGGPAPLPDETKFAVPSSFQYNVVIDATTGDVLNGGITSTPGK